MHLDSHTDLWESYFGRPFAHGTMFRRAVEEGVVDPSRVVQAGMHGPLYNVSDEEIPAELGVQMIPWNQLVRIAPEEFATIVRERIGDGPTFLTFDIDFVDAAFAPGTGTPEVGGPTSFQAMAYVRALADLDFIGYDVVEVAPVYDGPGQITSLLAANLIFDLLAMVAAKKQRAVVGSRRVQA